MRIGIMGGTFDPIHNGHLMLGKAAYESFHLDQIWYMPNGNPPHKDMISMESNVGDRLEMVRLAIEPYREFKLEAYEANRRDVSYSYSTLEYFKEMYPEDEFYFIIGADSLFMIDHWVHPERIFPTCTILAAYRGEINTRSEMEERILELQEQYDARIELLITPLMKVSSHELREALKEGQSIASHVPEAVADYISKNHLYVGE
ncbi:nicotinate-nucleotide adenylyltransferase [Bariatricus sp. SGI.154]|uniref:nicotinate-nucleotide adenylyltransferase n=1 Tax=Bariatricus sp. SGI.154 TaxID=3420549 RepID=UPI003D06739F